MPHTLPLYLLLTIALLGSACQPQEPPPSTSAAATPKAALISSDAIPAAALRVGIQCDPDACACHFSYPRSSGSALRSDALVVAAGQRVALDFSDQGRLDSLFFEGLDQTLRPTSKQAFVLPVVPAPVAEHSALLAELSCSTAAGGVRQETVVYHWVVVSSMAFERFLRTGDLLSLYDTPVAKGRALFVHRGCAQCHAVDGSALVGPPLNGIFGRTRQLTSAEGVPREVVVDVDYVTQSILNPRALVSPGYANNMPVYEGVLEPREVALIVAYLQQLR